MYLLWISLVIFQSFPFLFYRYEGKFSVQLDAIGYTFLPGHRLSVTVCPNYWPFIGMPRKCSKIKIEGACLRIPFLDASDAKNLTDNSLFENPRHGPSVGKEWLRHPAYSRWPHTTRIHDHWAERYFISSSLLIRFEIAENSKG